jgi:hypothetical protein
LPGDAKRSDLAESRPATCTRNLYVVSTDRGITYTFACPGTDLWGRSGFQSDFSY